MKCQDIKPLISAYANDELPGTGCEFVEEHLKDCAECRNVFADDSWARDRLVTLRSIPEVNITNETMGKIGTARGGTSRTNRVARRALMAAAVAAVLAVVAVLQLTGTGGGPGISDVYAATASLNSYRMTGTTQSTAQDTTTEVAFDWEFVAPDSYRATFTHGDSVNEFINIGNEQYVRDDGDPSSQVSVVTTGAGFSVFNPIPSQDGILELLGSLIDVETLPAEKIAELDMIRYAGRVDVNRILDEQLEAIDLTAEERAQAVVAMEPHRAAEIDVELWVGIDDSRLWKMILDSRIPIVSTTGDGVVTTEQLVYRTEVRYQDFDAIIGIDPPLSPSGAVEPGWRLEGADGGASPDPVIGTR